MSTEKRREIDKRQYYKNRPKRLIQMQKWSNEHRYQRTEYYRKYRATKKGHEIILKSVRKYQKIHPERPRAWSLAKKLPMQPCIKCGEVKTHRHHPDISKPLEVIFLCPFHHSQVHLNSR